MYAESKILNTYRSEYSSISLYLFIGKIERGRGIWKINNSLLKDEDFINKIKKEIHLIVSTYAWTPYSPESISNHGDHDIELGYKNRPFLGCTSYTSMELDN